MVQIIAFTSIRIAHLNFSNAKDSPQVAQPTGTELHLSRRRRKDMVTSLRNRHPHSSIEEGAEINLCHDKPSPRRGHYHRIRWSSSILLFLLIAIVGIQAGSKPWLVFRTGLITDLHRHLGRVLYSRMWGMANQVQAEIPEKRAAQLLHINCTFETTRRFPAAFKELDSCANMSYSRASKAAKPNTKEWNQWVTSEGTKHAPFQVSRLPGDQEFPEYQSKSPCGIHQVKKSTTGRFGHQVVAAGSEADIKGTALVVEADSESNLGHSLRAGLCICTYLLHSNLQKDGHLPLTLYIWWDAHSQPSLAVRSFKIQMLSALGEVRAYTEDEPDQPPKVLKHERVYEAPWNGNPLWHDWALVGGPVQLFFGERVNRLSMSSIVVNREPLKMYKGFAAAIRKGLQVPAREVSEGNCAYKRMIKYRCVHDTKYAIYCYIRYCHAHKAGSVRFRTGPPSKRES
ncbi:hypothetical protein AAMO2058_001665600 [Amorphochlora amoebiformis]